MSKRASTSTKNKNPIRLFVRSHFYEGAYQFTVLPNCPIREIKKSIVTSYYKSHIKLTPIVIEKLIYYHRLLAPFKTRFPNDSNQLKNTSTIQDCALDNNDELFLIRTLPASDPIHKPRNPRQLELDDLQDKKLEMEVKKEMRRANIGIDQKSSHITALDLQELQVPEFFSDMRRLVYTFMEIVISTLCTLSPNPKVDSILYALKNYFLDILYPNPLNPAYVIEYRELGFSERRTKYAFFINRNRTNDAVEWLKNHKSLASADIPEDLQYQHDLDAARRQIESIPINSPSIMMDLLKDYRDYCFRPDQYVLGNLKDLGYSHEKVIETLKLVENSYPAAYRLLSGDKSPSLHRMDHLQYPNRLYAAMNEKILRYHILDTKVLLALLAFYREPERIIFGWCWNREVAPIIFEIFEVYNIEMQDLNHCETRY